MADVVEMGSRKQPAGFLMQELRQKKTCSWGAPELDGARLKSISQPVCLLAAGERPEIDGQAWESGK